MRKPSSKCACYVGYAQGVPDWDGVRRGSISAPAEILAGKSPTFEELAAMRFREAAAQIEADRQEREAVIETERAMAEAKEIAKEIAEEKHKEKEIAKAAANAALYKEAVAKQAAAASVAAAGAIERCNLEYIARKAAEAETAKAKQAEEDFRCKVEKEAEKRGSP